MGDSLLTGEPQGGGEPQSERGGASTGTWLDQLSPELRENEELQQFKGPTALAQKYLEVSKSNGGLQLPGENATDEERAAFYEKLGRPKEPDGYELQDPKELPEGMRIEESIKKDFTKKFHELGLTKEQAAGVYDLYNNIVVTGFNEAQRERKEARDAAETALRQEYGTQYPAKIGAMKRLWEKYGDDEVGKLMVETGSGNHPALIRMMIKIGEALGEDQRPGTEEPAERGAQTGPRDRFEGTGGEHRIPYGSIGEKSFHPNG